MIYKSLLYDDFQEQIQDFHKAQEKLSKSLPKSQTVIDTISIIAVCHDQFPPELILRRDFSISSSSYIILSIS